MRDFKAIYNPTKIYNNSKRSNKKNSTNINTNTLILIFQAYNVSFLIEI